MAAGAGLKAVQSGSATIADGASSTTATITAVDTTKSFVVFSERVDSVNPIDAQVSGQLTNATTVTFARMGTTGAVAVEWYVAEFTSGVSVQRGSVSSTNTSIDVTLPSAVTLSQSFPLVSMRTDGTTFNGNDFVAPTLTTATNLNFALKSGLAATSVIEWQVVDFTGASVQS